MKKILFKLAATLTVIYGSLMPNLAISQTACAAKAEDCSKYQDPLDRAQCTCLNSQLLRQCQNSATVSGQWNRDDYADNMSKNTQNKAANGSAMVAKSCNSLTSGVFNSALKSAGDFFGADLVKLMGNEANAQAGSICQEVNSQIANRVNAVCPKVTIPGLKTFSANCNVGLNVGANGVGITGGGNIGGYTVGTSGNVSTNGVFSGSGNYNMGQSGSGNATVRGSADQGIVNQNATVKPNSVEGQGSSKIQEIGNSIGCFFSGC